MAVYERGRRTYPLVAVLGLYAATWAGPTLQFSASESRRAAAEYQRAESLQRRQDAECQRVPSDLCVVRVAFDRGPRSHAVAVPLLPLVALVLSGYSAGPLWGEGSLKLVLWYGVDSIQLGELFSWKH